MISNNLIRTAAIVFSEENTTVQTSTIQRKIVEAVFLEENNERLSVNQIIDFLKKSLALDFSTSEIEQLINDKASHFEVFLDSSKKESFICLSNKRYAALLEKETKFSITVYITKFVEDIYRGSLSEEQILDCLHKFFYELLNTNISAFQKMASPKFKPESLFINPEIFKIDERSAINEFLEWEDSNKNLAIFALISYSLEYALITNNYSSSSLFLNSVRNKIFFLDSNIIFRAIGINGVNRKNRILTFLKKCKDSGQIFKISKFTETEFKETVRYHINQLQKVPFRKIDHRLFSRYCINPSIYEYYHEWRANHSDYRFELFFAHILVEFDSFKKSFQIVTENRVPFKESSASVKKILLDYQKEIGSFKTNGAEISLYYDAINTFLIEELRGKNNTSITDTKYYFVSTDQKLRKWDFSRNNLQPIALLPSQWLAILLKYYSRTENDYHSFVLFLKLKTNQPIISQENLQPILSGISEITQSFEDQEKILDKMVEVKFAGILNGKSKAEDIFERTIEYVAKEYDEKISRLKEHVDLSKKDIHKQQVEFKTRLMNEKAANFRTLVSLKQLIEKEAQSSFLKAKIFYSIAGVGLLGLSFGITRYLGWNEAEPFTWGIPLTYVVGSYLYSLFTGTEFSLNSFFINESIPKQFLTIADIRLQKGIRSSNTIFFPI